MENGKGYFMVDKDCSTKGRFVITSKAIKYSKLELAWRVGITVAVIALICLSV